MLRGRLVNLRALERQDLKRIVDWMNDPELTQWLGPRFPTSLEEQEAWYVMLIQDHTKKSLIIEDKEGTAVGMISLLQLDWRTRQAELVTYIGERERLGQGYGPDANWAMLRFAFDELGLNRIYIRVVVENTRALSSAEKCGFKREGVMRSAAFYGGCHHDVAIMSILAAEFAGIAAP